MSRCELRSECNSWSDEERKPHVNRAGVGDESLWDELWQQKHMDEEEES